MADVLQMFRPIVHVDIIDSTFNRKDIFTHSWGKSIHLTLCFRCEIMFAN